MVENGLVCVMTMDIANMFGKTGMNTKIGDHLLVESLATAVAEVADRFFAARLVEVAKVSAHEVGGKQFASQALPFLVVERDFCWAIEGALSENFCYSLCHKIWQSIADEGDHFVVEYVAEPVDLDSNHPGEGGQEGPMFPAVEV